MESFCNELKAAVAETRVGDPRDVSTSMGPVVSKTQWERVQGYIRRGTEEGATLLIGGPGRPEGISHGYFVRPTIFTHVRNDMVIAREEIFGPVLCVIGYGSLDEALEIANDSPYGLAGYVQGANPDACLDVARRLRAGRIVINGAPVSPALPFGGYKCSGNGRECGRYGFEEYLEVKGIAVSG